MIIVCVAVDSWGNVGVVVRGKHGYELTIVSEILNPQSYSRYGVMLSAIQPASWQLYPGRAVKGASNA